MTAIGSILTESFLDLRRPVFWLLALDTVCIVPCFLVMFPAAYGTVDMSFTDHPYYFLLPLFSFGLGITAIGWHLRQMLLEGEESEMLPHFHKRQLAASGIVAIINLLIFLALTLSFGWLPLPALAGFLSVTALALWFGFYFLGGLLLLHFSLVLAAKSPSVGAINNILVETLHAARTVVGIHESVWLCFLIVMSLGGIVFFCVRYLNISCTSAVNHRFFIFASGGVKYLQPEQRAHFIKKKEARTNRRMEKALSRINSTRRGQPLSFFQQTRLIRLVMSQGQEYSGSRNRSIHSNYMRVTAVCFGVVAEIYGWVLDAIFAKSSHNLTFFMLPVMCFVMLQMTASTFQSNKNQLPMLYLQADLPSKSTFIKAAAVGYLLSVAEPFLIFTGAALTIHIFFPIVAWPLMFQFVIMMAAMVPFITSILLLTDNRRKTPPGPGWKMDSDALYFYPFIFVVALVISYQLLQWVIAGIFAIAGVSVLCVALRRWAKSEMDCA